MTDTRSSGGYKALRIPHWPNVENDLPLVLDPNYCIEMEAAA